ncbi:MAG: DUF1684 domain-containing protein [Xanthomonadales bacterium]|nr:DUF1684 domain-containing protein [Xanthomonadales bacterium]
MELCALADTNPIPELSPSSLSARALAAWRARGAGAAGRSAIGTKPVVLGFVITALMLVASAIAAAPGVEIAGRAGAPAPVAEDDFQTALAHWQTQRAQSLSAATGWVALVGLHWLDPQRRLVLGSSADADLVIEDLPSRLGQLQHDGQHWQLHLAPGLAVEVADSAVSDRLALIDDRAARALGQAPVRARHGPVRFTVIERDQRHALRVWNEQAPARNGFAGPAFYPPAPEWQLQARWQAHPPGRTLAIVDVTGAELAMTNPGAVLFDHDGRQFRLEALAEPEDEHLLLIFADRSNGRETYGAGRYLSAPRPDADGADGQVRLDFNRAYNPPCAYTAFATCPLPPPENRLDLWLRAGERR